MTRHRVPVLIVALLILAAFGVGVVVGSRFTERPSVYAGPVLQSSSGVVSAPHTIPSPSVAAPCVDIHSAPDLMGKNGCVSGLILRVYTAASGNTFLDFCQDYRTCPFTSVIFAADKAKFGDVGSLQGSRVELRGGVVSYEGRAEIVIHEPRQVRSLR